MPQGFKGWAAWLAGQAVFTGIWKLIYKLVENAMIGWGDDQISAYFGITSPTAANVFSWLLPFVLAGLTLWLYHLAQMRIAGHAAIHTSGDRFSAIGVVGDEPPQRTWIRKVEPHHIIIFGLVVALCGVVWQLRSGSKAAPPPINNSALTSSPFRNAINYVLIKRGQPISRADDGSIHMGSEGPDDNYIAYWNTEILGPWPTVADGFTARQLRKSPPSGMSEPIPNSPSTALARAIDAYLAKNEKTAHWNETIEGHQYIGLGTLGGNSPEFISYWYYPALGPWPTEDDGFSRAQLYALPKKRPNFKTQFDRENFRAEVSELHNVLNKKMGEMLRLSDELVRVPLSQDTQHKMVQILDLHQEIEDLIFLRGSQGDGKLFDKSNYKELLMGALPDDWQVNWVNYNVAFRNFDKAVALWDRARQHADDPQLVTLASDIGPQVEGLRIQTGALRSWLTRTNQCIDLLVSAI